MGVCKENLQKQQIINDKRIGFWSNVIYADKLWFVSNKHDFMCIDVKTGNTEYVDWIECRKREIHVVTDKMMVYKSSIYWVDSYKNYVHEYNPEKNDYHKYSMIEIQDADIHNEYITGMYIYKDVMWFFLRSIPQIVKFNLNQKKWETYSIQYSKQENDNSDRNEKVNRCSVQAGDKVYLFQNGGKLLIFNLNTFDHKWVVLPNELFEVNRAIWKDNCFYILTHIGNVYIWNERTGLNKKIYHCQDKSCPFGTIAVTEHKVFLLPNQTEKILIVDLQKQNEIKQAECPTDLRYDESIYAKYAQYTEDSSYIWFDNRSSNYILRINKENEQIEWIKPQLPTVLEEWTHGRKQDNDFALHEATGSLKKFIKIKKQGDQREKDKKSVGIFIWDVLNKAKM